MKHRIYSLCLALVALVFLSATYRREEDLKEVFQRIQQEVTQNSKAYETLAEACATIGHRLTGSSNGRRAEEFAYNLLRKYGYGTDARYHTFEVESWMRDTVTLVVVPNKSDNYRDVPVVALAHSPVDAKVKGAIVDVGNGLEADFEAVKDKVKGKIALANIGLLGDVVGKKNLHRSEKTALAIKYGATGIIMVNTVPGNILLTGTASVTGSLIPIPAVCVSLESGNQIRKWIQEENLQAVIDMHNFSRMIQARNVIANYKGSDKKLSKEKIIVGGHLDSWDLATGSTDNGLGSFSVLDIARTFKALNLKTKRTIEFVVFMGEEQGLLGSRAMVQDLVKTKEIENIRLMMNMDMTNNPKGFNIMGRDELMPLVTQIGAQIQSVDPTYTNDNNSRTGLHSDHQGFMLEGVPTTAPGSTLSMEVFRCYHANCDRMNLVKKEDMQSTVRTVSMMLYGLANASDLPVKKLNSEATRDFLVKQGLKQELIIGKDWRWGE
ncbi:MAG: M20/M25/M40 family metallo-hydrolase [Spirosomataceae bacterium]